MYRSSDAQKPLFDASRFLPPGKQEQCEQSWAGPFRQNVLPILRNVEKEFAQLYHPQLGRPNRPVELVLGVLILKDMFDLTDEQALEALSFDARWWYALERHPEELARWEQLAEQMRAELGDKLTNREGPAIRRAGRIE